MTIRVLVVDDNAFVRMSVVSVLRQVDGFVVVGECADGADVAVATELVRPDVVLTDLQMPVMSGIDVAWILRTTQPAVRVLILSGLMTTRMLAAAASAGAVGFVHKDGDASSLVRAVRAVAAGGTAWPTGFTPGEAALVDSARR